MAVRRLSVEIVGSAKGAQKAFGDLEKASGRAGKKTESSLSKANKALIGFGAGAAIYGAFSAFDEAQKVTAQTEAVLKSTGGAANVTSKEIEDLAGSLSKKTGVDDEAIQSGENLIATFTNIRNEAGEGNDVFTQTTKAALDMSVAMGTDMKSASMQLGKALNDPVAGLSKLTKVGVTFTAAQKDQIKALAESGDTLGAQKVILQELNKEFGGSAEAQATALGKAKVSVDNMAESVGGALAPALESAASALGFLADGFSGLPSSVQTAVLGLGLATVAAVKWGDSIGTGLSAMKTGASTIGGFASALGSINTLAAERGLSRVDTLLNVLDAGGNKKTASTVRGVKGVTDALGGMTGASVIGAGAIAGVSVALWKMQADSERAKNNMKSLQKQIESGMTPGEAAAQKLTNTLAGLDGGFEGLAGSSKQFRKNMKEMGMTATDVAALISAPADEWEAAAKRMANTKGMNKHQASEFVSNIDMMRSSVHNATEADKTLNAVQKELGVSAEGTAGDVGALGGQTEEQAAASEAAAAATQKHADAMARADEKAKLATDSIQNFYDATTATTASQIDVEAAIDAVTESFKANGTTLDIGTEKGRANTSAIIDAKDAQVDLAMELRNTSGSNAAIASMVSYSTKLHDTLRASGLTEEQTNQLIAQMKLTPKDIYTKFGSNATAAESKTQGVINKMSQVPGWKNTYFDVDTANAMNKLAALQNMLNATAGMVSAGVGGGLGRLDGQRAAGHDPRKPGRAKGGSVHRGSIYEVNEDGTELFAPGMTGSIIPAAQSRALVGGMAAGGSPTYITVQVQGNVIGIDNFASELQTAMNKQTRRDGRSGLIVSRSRAVVG